MAMTKEQMTEREIDLCSTKAMLAAMQDRTNRAVYFGTISEQRGLEIMELIGKRAFVLDCR
jgi:hypothetical protein